MLRVVALALMVLTAAVPTLRALTFGNYGRGSSQWPSSYTNRFNAYKPYNQHSRGYATQKFEHIDNPTVYLPDIVEHRPGTTTVVEKHFPDEYRENRIDINKIIHNYSVQRKITNVNRRILHKYFKKLLVNTVYNTNVQRVRHQKLINLLQRTIQEVHQPKLLVKFSRQDVVNNLGTRDESPIVVTGEERRQFLPPVILPAVVHRVGYNGQPMPTMTQNNNRYFDRKF